MDFAITSGGFRAYLNDGNGNFTFGTAADNGISFTICNGDFDNDGFDDIVMKTNQLKFFLNTQTGAFESPTIFNPANENNKSLRSVDLNNDGNFNQLT